MINRLVLAALVGAIVYFVCIFVGPLLAMTNIPIAAYVGEFIARYAVAFSIIAALWAFFSGGGLSLPSWVTRPGQK